MGARTKLNTIAIYGSQAIAAIFGGMSGSWSVFAVVAALLLAGSIYAGEIRLARRRPTHRGD